MRDIRVFHHQPLADDIEVGLGADADRHLRKVLRLAPGAGFTLFDGSGREWPATLLEDGRARTTAAASVERESRLRLTLVQGISRGERMDWTIQKAVELGVAAIVPVFTERSTVKLDGARLERRLAHWRGVVVAACEQCGRNRLPAVAAPIAFEDWSPEGDARAFVLDPRAAVGFGAVQAPGAAATLVAGPEGGLTDAEIGSAVAAGCVAVRLGPRVLRTETAGIAALAALQALYGDLAR